MDNGGGPSQGQPKSSPNREEAFIRSRAQDWPKRALPHGISNLPAHTPSQGQATSRAEPKTIFKFRNIARWVMFCVDFRKNPSHNMLLSLVSVTLQVAKGFLHAISMKRLLISFTLGFQEETHASPPELSVSSITFLLDLSRQHLLLELAAFFMSVIEDESDCDQGLIGRGQGLFNIYPLPGLQIRNLW